MCRCIPCVYRIIHRIVFAAAALSITFSIALTSASARAEGEAPAISTSALINKALDDQVKLTINDVLPRAMEAISRQTSVRIEADPAVWDLLPWGQDTNVNARIENKTLREALTLITQKLGLTWALQDESIQIQPMPALRRLARRADLSELKQLDLLAGSPLDPKGETKGPLPLRQVLDMVDARLADMKSPFAIENRSGESVRQDVQINIVRGATLLDALEAVASDSSATWYPWGRSVMVVTRENRVRAMLSRTIDKRYSGADALQVLLDLSRRSGVPFDIASGSVQQIPQESRSFHANVENATCLQVLDALCAATGLSYTVKDNGVVIANNSAAGVPTARDPVIGSLQTEVGIQVFLRAADLPPDVREYLKSKTASEIEKIRAHMDDEGFHPTTKPAAATRPADETL